MKPFQRRASFLAALIFAGCGGEDLSKASIKTVPARGKIMLSDGKPLTGGIIFLEPLPDGGSTNQAVAEIKSDGSFEAKSTGDQMGAMPGKYRVKIETEAAKVKMKSGQEPIVEVTDGQDLVIKLP